MTDTDFGAASAVDPLFAGANVSLASELGRGRRLRLAVREVGQGHGFVVIVTSPQRTPRSTSTC